MKFKISATLIRNTATCLLAFTAAGCTFTQTGQTPSITSRAFSTAVLPTADFTLTASPVALADTSTPHPTQTSTRIASSMATPTSLPMSTDTATSLPTVTATQIDIGQLPRLSEVVINENDLPENDYSGMEDYRWMFLYQADATQELADNCLLDCVKRVYGGAETNLTIILLRAGNPEKALRTADNLKQSFLGGSAYEYPPNTYRELGGVAPNSWVIERGPVNGGLVFSIGTAYGSIVVLVVSRFDFCGEVDGQLYCEGDAGHLAGIANTFANLQLSKLKQSGYLP